MRLLIRGFIFKRMSGAIGTRSGGKDPHFLGDRSEDFEGLVDLSAGVFAGHDGANASFAFGNGGEGDASGHDAGVEEGAAKVHGATAVADDDGGDGGLALGR
jgi:hypothetical protein